MHDASNIMIMRHRCEKPDEGGVHSTERTASFEHRAAAQKTLEIIDIAKMNFRPAEFNWQILL